tara:strand:+ start:122 stop:478 length:357 start_codon:yes stop_codon:yes gene_type:complete
MIDTDKYEGHTEGPWRIVEGDSIYDENEYWLAIRSAKGFDVTELSGTTSDIGKSDWNLIADAPLLLAEVKRLREALITVQQSLVWDEKDRAMDGDPITLEAFVVQVEQVRSNITEMIE